MDGGADLDFFLDGRRNLAIYYVSRYYNYQGSLKWVSRPPPILTERMKWRKPQQFPDL